MNFNQLQKRLERDRQRKAWQTHIDRVNRDVEAQERQAADEDNAYTLLDCIGTLNENIERGLIAEDERHTLTITAAGWERVKAMGWEATV
ncbi:MAG: hypothetical protein ABI700_00700 [Chloroflexota bacterium]